MPSSIVTQIVNIHRAQLQGIIELGGVRKMRSLYDKVRQEMEAKLAELKSSGRGQSFSAHHARQVQAQVMDGLRQINQQLGVQLSTKSAAAAKLARGHTISAVQKMERRFAGTTPVLGIEQAGVFSKLYAGVEPSLLTRHHKLVFNYPKPTIARVQKNLAMSMLTGETVDKAVDRIVSQGGVFSRERYRAERIVRTEMSYAYGVTNQACLRNVAQEVPNLQKRLVATFDDRIGEDSEELNGQTVPIDRPFIWMKRTKGGVERVEYMQPPNRPNDREVVIPWRSNYKGAPSEPGAVSPEMP
jgi:hypothetical protein